MSSHGSHRTPSHRTNPSHPSPKGSKESNRSIHPSSKHPSKFPPGKVNPPEPSPSANKGKDVRVKSSHVRLHQLRALLWKEYIIRTKSSFGLFMECFLIFGILLIVSRLVNKGKSNDNLPTGNSTNTITYYKEVFSLTSDESLKKIKNVYFCPDDATTKGLMDMVTETYKSYSKSNPSMNIIGFHSEDLMQIQVQKDSNDSGNPFTVGLIFTDSSNGLQYKLKPGHHHGIPTKILFTEEATKKPSSHLIDLYTNGVSQVHFLVNEAFTQMKAKSLGVTVPPTMDIQMHYRPYPPYVVSKSKNSQFLQLLPVMIVYGAFYFFQNMIKRITIEKQNGTRDMFTLMGLTDYVYWGSILISNYIVIVIPIILLDLIMFGIPYGFPFLELANKVIIFLYLNLHMILLILNGCLLSIPFNKPIVAQIVCVIYFAFSYEIANSGKNGGSPLFLQATSFLPNGNIIYFLAIMIDLEEKGPGLQWNNLFHRNITYGYLSVGGLMFNQVLSILLCMLMIWYLDKVWPWQSGIVQSPFFFVTANYWSPSHNVHRPDKDDKKQLDPKYFEKDDSKEEAIHLTNVSKQYNWTGKPAVDNITFSIYKDQITCLLGHNGAGKTTTMSMITGVFHPSRGTINVNGYDLLTQTAEARRSMSLCPQHNPLYDIMTVNEHLTLYGAIKGYPWKDLKQEVKRTVEAVTLVGHEKKNAGQLSGGMKRKLCLGIALIGGTEVIILDEPTSGLDTEARRSIWDSLRNIRKNKTILLSTHDMEEADALGDRVIIMASGSLLCSGSTYFLRKAYDAGYTLKIAKANNFNQQQTEQVLKQFFPNFKLKAQIGTEISYNLRNVEGSKPPLPPFFREFQKQKVNLGIESYGLSVTTMEDIFLKAGAIHDQEMGQKDDDSKSESVSLKPELGMKRSTGAELNQQRAYGLFMKRFHFARRYLPIFFTQILLPALIMVFAFTSLNEVKKIEMSPALPLKLGTLYPNSDAFLSSDGTMQSKLTPFCHSDGCNPKSLPVGQDVISYFDGLTKTETLAEYVTKNIVGLKVDSEDRKRIYHAWISHEAIHSNPLGIDMIYKILNMEMTQKDASTIETSVQSFAVNIGGQIGAASTLIPDTLLGFLLPVAFSPLASAFILFPIHENVSKVKLVQLMTGLDPFLYYLVHWFFDNLINLLSSIILIGVIIAMDTNHIMDTNNIICSLILFIMYGASSVPFAYLWSLMFTERVSGYSALNGFNVIFAFVATIVIICLSFVKSSSFITIIEWIARIIPTYSVAKGFRNLYKNSLIKGICHKISPEALEKRCLNPGEAAYRPCCPNLCEDLGLLVPTSCVVEGSPLGWSDNEIGKELFMMAVTGIVCLLLLIAFERGIITYIHQMFSPAGVPDPMIPEKDVDGEKVRVDQMVQNKSTDQDALIAHKLMKKFSKKYVVNGMSFGVHKSEIFGLLGVNGAGKTTTFSMMTGDLKPTSGETYQGSQTISSNRSKFQEELGYCPQFNPILEKLTGREMLFLFGRLRGIGNRELPDIVEQIVHFVDLKPHVDKRTETYSGGNQRKLSLGLALIGRPKVLLLDEPTAGVDPGARRKIWHTLNEAKDKFNCSVVLTSHSMDECEALCSRVGIMAGGQFRCLGSSQHLKSTYGQGYTINIKFDRNKLNDTSYIPNVTQKILKSINGAYVADKHEKVIMFRTNDTSTPWDQVFTIMDSINNEFKFEDYTISDTSLEQIFIAFARNQ